MNNISDLPKLFSKVEDIERNISDLYKRLKEISELVVKINSGNRHIERESMINLEKTIDVVKEVINKIEQNSKELGPAIEESSSTESSTESVTESVTIISVEQTVEANEETIKPTNVIESTIQVVESTIQVVEESEMESIHTVDCKNGDLCEDIECSKDCLKQKEKKRREIEKQLKKLESKKKKLDKKELERIFNQIKKSIKKDGKLAHLIKESYNLYITEELVD